VTAGPWPFGFIEALLVMAPIHGHASRGGGAARALRWDGSGGTRGVLQKRGMRRDGRGSGFGDLESARHTGNAYA
jgi:hypothetical protein